MAKKIELIIESCHDCPYCVYDSYYSMSTDSGYDCKKSGKRIVDDGVIETYDLAYQEYKKSLKTLFPLARPDLLEPFSIPKWCPLKDS